MLEIKIGKEKMHTDPEFSFFMGSASPLRFGRGVLDMAVHTLKRGQVVGIGGNCNCGVQSPITAASNIAIDHAERLAGMCIVTSIEPNARFYFCNHTYFLDMRSADIASGSPEQTLLALLGKKVLEHCGFQLVVNHPILDVGAHTPDGQAAAEKMMYALLTALGGARGIGGAGQLKEDFSYEQLVIDNEMAGYVKHLIKGAEITDETIALETIQQRGVGAHFLDCETTLLHLRESYYPPTLFYRKRKSEWLREGAKDLLERAHDKAEDLLSRDTPVFLSDAQMASMDEIILEACAELTDGWDPKPYL
jgi:trimethylamine--corrinoid protein Co-methyltransferase